MSKQEILSGVSLRTIYISFVINLSFGNNRWGRQSTGSKIEWVLRVVLTPVFNFLFKVFLICLGKHLLYRWLVHMVSNVHICWIIAPVCGSWWSLSRKKFKFHKLSEVPFHFIHGFYTITDKNFNLFDKPFVNGLKNASNLVVQQSIISLWPVQ